MNRKLILFSGIVTALAGAAIGLAAAEMGKGDLRQLRYESQVYADVQKYYIIVGATLGFAVGAGQECVRELKAERDRELEEEESS